ncbi:uncharacterized protein A1O9_12450 [Exophiala aquamarina CBS 119918]|uniref:Uncharacterized protein n=1 Tax=Exophiala aquamarina CBS 119918 TaxID=1182545 RepID=A0A072NWW6_9EURO|nr:uncharacterized protein A1O9_12450 [Exophiala aquamarina CBS 119918]KEF51533.1 hypothetical protein A1O9_12450 [Exophiala aquamarina CBS 119918]
MVSCPLIIEPLWPSQNPSLKQQDLDVRQPATSQVLGAPKQLLLEMAPFMVAASRGLLSKLATMPLGSRWET